MKAIDDRAEAEWLTRMGRWGGYALTVVAVLALVFTMVNVQQFAAHGQSTWSFQWWIAWLLDPMASIAMGTAIVWESVLADHGHQEKWLTATKWYAGGAVCAMNVWPSAFPTVIPSGVLLHIVAPGLVLLLAEATPRVRRHFGEIRAELDTAADTEEAALDIERLWDEVQTIAGDLPGVDDPDDFPRVGPPHPDTTEPTHPGPGLNLVPPPPPPPGVDPTIYAAARKLRDERAGEGLTTGRRVLLAELPARLPPGYRVTDTTARQLARVLAA